MDPLAIAQELCAFRGRAAGSDAERRAANRLAARLRETGRPTDVEPLWVNPYAAATYALHAALAAAGGLLAVAVPVAGLAVVAATLVSLVLDLSGVAFLLRRCTPRRATQNVVAGPGEDVPRPVVLVIAAHYDAPRVGLARRERLRRLEARARAALGGHAPGPFGLLAAAVTIVAGCCALRVAGTEGTVVSVVQLIPTVGLVLAVAALLDLALAPPGPGANDPASGVAVALAVADALSDLPPRAVTVEVVFAGAGAGPGPGLGMRAQVRALRRGRRREDVIVIGLGPCGRGRVRWLTREGALLARGTHRRMGELCAAVAAEEAHLGAAPAATRTVTAAHAARAAGLPAVAIACLDADGIAAGSGQLGDVPERLDARAMRDAVEFCLALVAKVDDEVAERRGAAPPARAR
jgi:hypothetical protein